jgi:cellobiose PTS system EIIC component
MDSDTQNKSRLETMREGLLPLADRIANNSMLLAIRDGVVATLPLIMLGSLFALIASPPVKVWADALAKNPELMARLQIPNAVTSSLIALYLAFSMGSSLAKRRNLDVVQGGLLSLAAFLMAMQPGLRFATTSKMATNPASGQLEKLITPIGKPEWSLPMPHLGAEGILVAIVLAFVAVEILGFFTSRKWVIRLPASVPPTISQPFASLVPGLVVLLVVWALFHLLRVDLFGWIVTVIQPLLLNAGDSLPWVLVMVLLDSIFWLFGIHAVVLLALAKPIWVGLQQANLQAAIAHTPLQHIAAWPFYNWFVWTGGSGAVLPLAFMLLWAKAKSLRTVGKLSVPSVIFNINEPLMYGAPIVLNPTLAIPFFLAPAVSACISWVAMSHHLVARPYLQVPWTLPAPVGAWGAVGGDWRAIVLVLVNISVCTLIYWPFFRAYDRQVAAREEQSDLAAD